MPDQREQQNQQGGKGGRQQGRSQKDDHQRQQPNQSGPILDRRSKGGGTISRAMASRPVNNRTANLSEWRASFRPGNGSAYMEPRVMPASTSAQIHLLAAEAAMSVTVVEMFSLGPALSLKGWKVEV
jgi:hypothetical protein